MGKTIVSWSPVHGQAATTSNVAALAAHFALIYTHQSLITHTQLTYSSLESLFKKEMTDSRGFDSGIEALERLAQSSLLKPDAVRDYTETVYKNRLDLLGGTQNQSLETPHLLEILLKVAESAYDIVWIDAHSGTRSNTSKRLLKKADLVIVNLPQNRFVLDQFFSGEGIPEELKNKDFIVLISQYDQHVKPGIQKIKSKYGKKHPVFAINYSSKFKDSANKFEFTELFYRVVNSSKGSDIQDFIKSLEKVNKYILKKLDLEELEEEDE
ncbi:hypothetical protein [Lysinibacillus fusiformis]|uniref:hypothetical protein n=1 Tax=Lysinibacillus fusiformis TaxID=28031 RepID=UPI00088DA894|nr:hypothetical protein [Lysinibacillus fusiformis]SCX63193.1 hypothetical protein SAMN02787108_03202 [Lysinibacillus fusiformis]SDB45848.1 hypothetical protein SAMN02787070_03397 [Lysinibacillus fusiformis]SFI71487.1 hypothetical protein SAMN02787080_03415 [Lysinibacillus fusiformis]SFT15027.1 hypothetical protein SAMN02787099_03117 [Lysinibacillus fusiformis]